MHSTSMHYINDLQPWCDKQLPQDFFFASAMLWPQMNKTMFVADCDTFSVDEIDALTGDRYAQQHFLLHVQVHL